MGGGGIPSLSFDRLKDRAGETPNSSTEGCLWTEIRKLFSRKIIFLLNNLLY